MPLQAVAPLGESQHDWLLPGLIMSSLIGPARTGQNLTVTYVRSDNGPEFTAAALIDWCNTAGVDTAFIDPGSPWQNGFAE